MFKTLRADLRGLLSLYRADFWPTVKAWWGRIAALSTSLGIIISAIVYAANPEDAAMKEMLLHLAWQVPLIGGLCFIVLSLFLVPYRKYKEKAEEADKSTNYLLRVLFRLSLNDQADIAGLMTTLANVRDLHKRETEDSARESQRALTAQQTLLQDRFKWEKLALTKEKETLQAELARTEKRLGELTAELERYKKPQVDFQITQKRSAIGGWQDMPEYATGHGVQPSLNPEKVEYYVEVTSEVDINDLRVEFEQLIELVKSGDSKTHKRVPLRADGPESSARVFNISKGKAKRFHLATVIDPTGPLTYHTADPNIGRAHNPNPVRIIVSGSGTLPRSKSVGLRPPRQGATGGYFGRFTLIMGD
jgi:hypothetical protein